MEIFQFKASGANSWTLDPAWTTFSSGALLGELLKRSPSDE